LPMVSVHVPTYNEPPLMVIETLNALARLDYPRYEVIVMDNNTKNPDVWEPVQAHCERLGPHFRFFHVDPLSGFKAGALNLALAHTSPDAEIIGVIDSDYTVDPAWLKDLAPQFSNPKVAVVQAPQDYRDYAVNAFKAMCYAEYRGFFFVGMMTRNERNAIIQHGTMTMIRRSVLEEIGGWSEWCITEDAELGLRVFERGYEAIYIPKSYGRGLMPDAFIDYKKQRFRWAYGAIQILRRHADFLLARKKSSLTYGQRYHFVAGWLPWMADGVNLLFNLAALLWSLAMIMAPKNVDPPLVEFSILPLALFSFKLGKLFYLYRTRVGATLGQTLAGAVAGLALSHTIAKAILLGFVTHNQPFLRTPKMTQRRMAMKALACIREEVLLMVALLASAVVISLQQGVLTLDLHLWVIVLWIQSIPYGASLAASIISGFSTLPARFMGKTLGKAMR
jgi:cellulose synthase/poly-beta-1,6-N-acetylglucosamine synthase-like glycosyltransferase